MKTNNNIIAWAMHNYRISFLIIGLLFVFGIYAVGVMPKQEFPEFTIRQGVVVAVFPGATSEEVEEQVARPLERFLFTYDEVKRKKTTSTSQNGMCYVMVELNDEVNNKDEVWSKIKHGLSGFKSQLPTGVLALVANDDFGDTSALLIAIESDVRSHRELETYADAMGDKLRTIESVSAVRMYGNVKEQISLYVDWNRVSAYGMTDKMLTSALAQTGLTPIGGAISNTTGHTPIHLKPTVATEQEIGDLIIYNDAKNNKIRVKDIAKIVRETPSDEAYIENNGARCIILSLEMANGYNIVEYGKQVDKILEECRNTVLPADVQISRIADQAKVVEESVNSFLRDLVLAMVIIILVMMLLFPWRSALVAAIIIPLSTFTSIGVMYACGIPLNTVTLAALIVVLGMIVDNAIVVIDGYLEYLHKGYSRWYAAMESARIYFGPMALATACICIIFYPLLITVKGQIGDFLIFFPWTVTINLVISLLLAVLIMPVLEVVIIRDTPQKSQKKSFTDYMQKFYEIVLAWTFRHGWLVILMGVASVVISFLIVPHLKMRMFPVADRDQLAVEIYLTRGKSLADTKQVADSIYKVLQADPRVKSVTSFIGCSSPRFQMSYAPQMADRNYAQFIVNTENNAATEQLLNELTPRYAEAFPEAFVKFKQLDYQIVAPLEFRFYGDDLDSLHAAANLLMDEMRRINGLMWIHSDYELPAPMLDVSLDPVAASQLGITRSTAALSLTMITEGMSLCNVWEGDYALPVKLINYHKEQLTAGSVQDIMLPGLDGTPVPLRQVATVEPTWMQGKIVHRNGVRCLTVSAELGREMNALGTIQQINDLINGPLKTKIPSGITTEIGGEWEDDLTNLPPIVSGIGIALVIIFFFILINFKKFGITFTCMGAMSLCLFGGVVGLWILNKTICITSVLGLITLLGMIVRNEILLYQHTEDVRKGLLPVSPGNPFYDGKGKPSARAAAYDAGSRRMVPIFLTTATTAVGVIPMILGGTTFWQPVGVVIFAGSIGSLLLVVTILPILYTKIYK